MSAQSEGIAIHRVTVRRHWSRRPVLLFATGAIGLLVALVLGVALGTVAVAPLDTIGILGRRLLGLPIAQTWTPPAETIVLDLRLPRVLEAMVVGLGLSVAGTAFQGLLRRSEERRVGKECRCWSAGDVDREEVIDTGE